MSGKLRFLEHAQNQKAMEEGWAASGSAMIAQRKVFFGTQFVRAEHTHRFNFGADMIVQKGCQTWSHFVRKAHMVEVLAILSNAQIKRIKYCSHVSQNARRISPEQDQFALKIAKMVDKHVEVSCVLPQENLAVPK